MKQKLLKVKDLLSSFVQVEMVIALGGFSALLLDPIRNEYIYYAIAGEKSLNYCSSENESMSEKSFNEDVSRWTLYLDLAMFIPASIAGIFITSWGDKVGRKMAMVVPLISMTLSSVIFALIVHFKSPIELLLLVNFSAGLGGYYMTLLMQGFAYLSDVTELENRGMRFLILDISLGVSGGIAGFCSGFWVDAMGPFTPILSTAGINLFALGMVAILPESAKIKNLKLEKNGKAFQEKDAGSVEDNSSIISSSSNSSHPPKTKLTPLELLRRVKRIYTSEYSHCDVCFGPEEVGNPIKDDVMCAHGGGLYRGRVWRMWAYLSAYNLYMFVSVGTMVFQTIYFLSPPLCFSQILVGLQVAIKFSGIAINPVFILLYRRMLNMSNNLIIVVGFIASFASYCIIAMATNHLLVFLGTALLALSFASKPFIQTQMTSLVSEWEQGSTFALVSFTESLSLLTATAVFLISYPATSSIFHGFSWFIAAGGSLFSGGLVMVLYVVDRKQTRKHRDFSDNEGDNEDTRRLIAE